MHGVSLILAACVLGAGLVLAISFPHDAPRTFVQYNPCPGGQCPPR